MIKYFGRFDLDENKEENRRISLAAINKMNYIIEAINECAHSVKIISISRTKNKKYYKGRTIKIDDKNELVLFPTFPWGNIIQKAFSLFTGNIILFLYMIANIKRNESIIVYHSFGFKNIIILAKKIKGFKMILEVEEIYQDVIKCSDHYKRMEFKVFGMADKFIFPTKSLDKKINETRKPKIIIHGTYKVEYDRKEKFNDNKIHVVYAGIFAPNKGASMAVAAAEFLTEEYHVHIIGFGTEEQKEQLIDQIKDVSKRSKASITFDGLLKGEEYVRFLQKCQIGLSTQNSDAKYNGTSFPSKVLSYLVNGLRVVSVRIKTIENSEIGNELFYYDKQGPEEIAKTIMRIDLNRKYDSREIIKQLDNKFKKELKSFLEM